MPPFMKLSEEGNVNLCFLRLHKYMKFIYSNTLVIKATL